MEPKFQTSFIPKKPMAGLGGGGNAPMITRPPRRITSVYMTLSVIIFIVSLAGIGAAYGYVQYLKNSKEGLKKELAAREKEFNIDRIEQLKRVNVQIDTAKSLLTNHSAVSSVFGIISQLTTENVRFLSFSIAAPVIVGDGLRISLDGVSKNLPSVAFQSKVLASLQKYNLSKIVKNPMLTDPSIQTNGTVHFGFTATIDPGSVSYDKIVNGSNESTSNVTP